MSTDSTVVYLPFSTYVNIRCFTNALFKQKITIQPETGSAIVYTGAGEHDEPMGNTDVTTPASGSSTRGYKMTVTVETDAGSGWQPSSVIQGSQSIMYYNLALVVSEDYVDNDWNDCVAIFTWWVPPDSRELADFQITPKRSKLA